MPERSQAEHPAAAHTSGDSMIDAYRHEIATQTERVNTLEVALARCERRLRRQVEFHRHYRDRAIAAERAKDSKFGVRPSSETDPVAPLLASPVPHPEDSAASTACDELLAEVTQLRDDLATYVLSGEGPMWTLPMVLDELCRILADEVPDAT